MKDILLEPMEGDRSRTGKKYREMEMILDENEYYTHTHMVRISIQNDIYSEHGIMNIIMRPNQEYIGQWTHTNIQAPPTTLTKFCDKLRNGSAVLVTDASDNKHGVSVAAFVEEVPMDQEGDDEINGYAQIPSNGYDLTSYRGELGGILQSLRYINETCFEEEIVDGGCTVKCDNEAAVERTELTRGYHPITTLTKNYDILRMIREEIRKCPIAINFQWVKGHQSNSTPYHELDDGARANDRADRLAGFYTTQCTLNELPLWDAAEGPYLQIKDRKIHGNIKGHIIRHIQGGRIKTYWRKKGRYTGNDEDVDWKTLDIAIRKIQYQDRHTLAKVLSGWNATSVRMCFRKEYTNHMCPLCKISKDDNRHLLRCTHTKMRDTFEKELKKIQDAMSAVDFIPHADTVVMFLLRQYSEGIVTQPDDTVYYHDLVEKQRSIGVNSFTEGIFHTEWRNRVTNITGASKLNRQILQMWITMWKTRNTILKEDENDIRKKEAYSMKYDDIMVKKPNYMNETDTKQYSIAKADFLLMTDKEKQTWINGTSSMISKYQRLQRKGIRQYFGLGSQDIQQLQHDRRIQRQKLIQDREIRELQRWMQKRKQGVTTIMLQEGQNINEKSDVEKAEWIGRMKRYKKRKQFGKQTTLTVRTLQMTTNKEQTKRTRTEWEIESHPHEKDIRNKRNKKNTKITDWLIRRGTPDG